MPFVGCGTDQFDGIAESGIVRGNRISHRL